MAIKIIKTEPTPEVLKQVECRNCGVTLEYTPIDVQSCHGKDIGGGSDGREWIICPHCTRDIILRSW